MAEEDDMKKLRPTQLWTPLITVESEEDSSSMPTVSTLSFIKKKTFLPIPRQEEDGTSSGISDQCNSDVDSNFSPSPSGSYKEADFMATNSDSSTLHSDEDFIEEDLTTPLSPVSPKRSGSPSRSRNMLSPVRSCSARCYKLYSSAAGHPGDERRSATLHALAFFSPQWSAVKKAMTAWSPFMQVYRKKYPWVQLAGHQGEWHYSANSKHQCGALEFHQCVFVWSCTGNFKPGGMHGTVLKKASEREQEALECLMKDRMRPFVPEFHKLIVKEDGSILFIAP